MGRTGVFDFGCQSGPSATVRANPYRTSQTAEGQGRLRAIAVSRSKDKVFALCSVGLTFDFDRKSNWTNDIFDMSKIVFLPRMSWVNVRHIIVSTMT